MFHRRWATWGVVVAAGWLVAIPAPAVGQQLGQLYVEATDASGQPVADLSASDVVVLEDEVEATIVSVTRADAPMRIALLVDSGDRVSETRGLNALRDGLRAFLDTLPPQHEIALFTIARQIQRRVDFTTDRDELRDAVGLIFDERGASTILLDGVRETWERRFDEDDAYPVIVLVLTDGTEGSSNYNDNRYEQLLTTLIVNDITLHTVIVNSRGGSNVSQYSLNLTQNAGGLYRNIATPTGLTNELTTVATRMGEHFDEVAKRYHVVYERPDPAGASISLRLNRGDVNIRLFGNKRIEQ